MTEFHGKVAAHDRAQTACRRGAPSPAVVPRRRPRRSAAGRQVDARQGRRPALSGPSVGSGVRSRERTRPRAAGIRGTGALADAGARDHRRGAAPPFRLSGPATARGPASVAGAIPPPRKRRAGTDDAWQRESRRKDRLSRARWTQPARDRGEGLAKALAARRLSEVLRRPQRQGEHGVAHGVPAHLPRARRPRGRHADAARRTAPLLADARALARAAMERVGVRPGLRHVRGDGAALARDARGLLRDPAAAAVARVDREAAGEDAEGVHPRRGTAARAARHRHPRRAARASAGRRVVRGVRDRAGGPCDPADPRANGKRPGPLRDRVVDSSGEVPRRAALSGGGDAAGRRRPARGRSPGRAR